LPKPEEDLMPTESIRVSARFPVTPDRLYAAWLDSQEHTRFTGDTARVDPLVGGRFSSWSGYISGENLELEPARRIVQSWRTTEFPDDSENSRVVVTFEPEGDGTRLTIEHTDIPEGHGDRCEDGWIDYYFEPMQRYFRRLAALLAAPDDEGSTTTRPARKGSATRRRTATRPAARAAVKKAAATARSGPARKAAAKRATPKRAAAGRATTSRRKAAGSRTTTARKAAKKTTARRASARKAATRRGSPPARRTARKATRRKGARRR
jgi:uncharacterized protein YndB with AHSA1/START domain